MTAAATVTQAEAFAPASVANVAVGFDLLGFSVGVAGDRVKVAKIPERRVKLKSISGLIVAPLPGDETKNTATAGLVRLLADLNLDHGFEVSIEKGIPLGSGMGGSAASAVAAVVAANALLPAALTRSELLSYALIGEFQASGSFHADNVAPSLVGGLTLARMEGPRGKAREGDLPVASVTSIPCPESVHCVLVLPKLSVETRSARGILRPEISLHDHIAQSANLAGVISGCYGGDCDLIARSLADVLIEPQRAHLIQGFAAVKEAALKHGALGCSISGSGPSVFAWARGATAAETVRSHMVRAFMQAGVQATGWALPLKSEGAKVVAVK